MDIQNTTFYELINVKKLKYLSRNLDNKNLTENVKIHNDRLKKQKSTYPQYNPATAIIKTLKSCIVTPELHDTDYAYVKVTYNKGLTSNNTGRWYSYRSVGMAATPCFIRNTVSDELVVDVDQVNSQPSILHQLMLKNNLSSPTLNKYMNNREKILTSVSKELKFDRNATKKAIIGIIFGGPSFDSSILTKLQNELKKPISIINSLEEYADISEFTINKYSKHHNLQGKIISRILQIEENKILEAHLEYFLENGFIKKVLDGYAVCLVFDGIMLQKDDNLNDDELLKCQEYTFEKTGYDIELKIKDFENKITLPDNLDVLDPMEAIIDKYASDKDFYVLKYKDLLVNAILNRTDADLMDLVSVILKNKVIYDEHMGLWYWCDVFNVWSEHSDPTLVKALYSKLLCPMTEIILTGWRLESINVDLDSDARQRLIKNIEIGEKFKKSLKLANSLKVVKEYYWLFSKNNFFNEVIDNKAHLFAFNNKVFDFSIKIENGNINDYIRPIKPTDYILTTTGYDFPDILAEDNLEHEVFLNKCLKDVYINDEKLDYILDTFATTLNGGNIEQNFNIHTGSGSNCKSSIMDLMSKVFGKYSQNIEPACFTQPKVKGAHDTFYLIKGKRWVRVEEPDSVNGNKLQSATLKIFADDKGGKIKGREIYKKEIEFPNYCKVDFSMNDKPELSSADGGIGRRLRIIEYDVKFTIKPDANNPYEKLLDPKVKDMMNSEPIRNTTIIMLLNRWINKVSLLEQIVVPQCIMDASESYMDDCDPVTSFFKESDKYEITQHSTDKIKTTIIYDEFKTWFKLNRNEVMRNDKFKQSMLKIKGITTSKSHGIMVFNGIREKINIDIDPDEEDPDEKDDIQR